MAELLECLLVLIVAGLGLSILVFQGLTGVPPHPATPGEAADVVALLKRAELPTGAVIYDLGSGWGSLVIALAKGFPDAEIRGIEMSPLPYWISRLRTRALANVSIRRGDLYRCALSDASAVACYLMIGPMPKLAAVLDRSLRAGTPVVALTFWFRGRRPVATLPARGLRGAAALYLWPADEAEESRGSRLTPSPRPMLPGRA